MSLRIIRGGMDGITFPSAPSTAVGQIQQLVNGAITAGRLPSAPLFTVDGKGDVRLSLAVEAIEPGATTAAGALEALRRGGYKPTNAQGLEEAPYQGGVSSAGPSPKKTAKKKTAAKVAKEAIMAPGVPWYRRPVTWILVGGALFAGVKLLGGRGAARRPFVHG